MLKNLFTGVPVLILRDPSTSIMNCLSVEVDAPDLWIGAVLSLKLMSDDKLPPCAFFLPKLSFAEWNYDVGDQQLLAIKVALEEWCHWWERAAQPFLEWTDNKNLHYLRSAK